MKKVNENSNEYIKTALSKTDERYEKLLFVVSALSRYFDNSIGVPDSAKQELKAAIKEAEELAQTPVNEIKSTVVKSVEAKTVADDEPKKTDKTDAEDNPVTVER